MLTLCATSKTIMTRRNMDSVISFRRMRNSWGWKRTRVLQITESIMISGVLLVTSIQQPSAL
ncbi:hypothetical protein EV702DRAFT_1270858, partial [Suillus placidus]